MNVIYVDFKQQKKKKKKHRKQGPTGVFIKPANVDVAMYTLSGNFAGFIAAYIAFNPDFSPKVFREQIWEEYDYVNDNDETGPEAA